MLKLSHSAVSKYSVCPKAYQYHYVERIRSNVTHAALPFGSALDKGLNALLTNTGDPETEFIKAFSDQEINDVIVNLPVSTNLVYADADFDEELLSLSTSDLDKYYNIRSKKKAIGFQLLSKEEKEFYNSMNWLSMSAKGSLMLRAYKEKIMPKLKTIIAVQETITLENSNGDSVIGYVDLVAEHEDHGIVVFDNKTAARRYEEDSVLTSPQLSLYVHALEAKYGTRKAGYIVLGKNIIKNRKKVCKTCHHDGSGSRAKSCDAVISGKRCGGEWSESISPDVDIQVVVDEIPEQTEQIVIENYDTVCKSIASESFPRNFHNCDNIYGGPCVYRSLCFKNSMKDLVKR